MSVLVDNERCVHELVSMLGLEQSAVSHQLRVLRSSSVVRSRKEGRHAYYALDDGHVTDLWSFALEHVRHVPNDGAGLP